MKKKTLAVAAIIFASILAIAPAAALSIDTLIDNQSIIKNSDVSALESGEKYCLANATVANGKAIINYYERVDGECAYNSNVETKSIELPIYVENEEIIERYAESGVEEGSTITVEDLDFVSAATEDSMLEDVPNYNHDIKAVNEELGTTLEYDYQSFEKNENFDFELNGNVIAKQGDMQIDAISNVKLDIRSVIYIPEDTEDSEAAYADAAQLRAQSITDKSISIEHAGKIANICEELELGNDCRAESDLAEELGTEDYYFFIIEDNGIKTIILVIKDDEKVHEFDSAYNLGGKGDEEEQPEEQTEEIIVATATSEENAIEPVTQPESVKTAAVANSQTAPVYSYNASIAKSEEKTEEKTEDAKPAATEEKKSEEEEERKNNPAPIIVCGAIFVIAIVALALKRNGKKYSK